LNPVTLSITLKPNKSKCFIDLLIIHPLVIKLL
jgi:hypothetical protein